MLKDHNMDYQKCECTGESAEKCYVNKETEESEMPYDDCLDSETPLNAPLSAKYKRSFGYVTVKDRLPVILTQIIDQLSRDKEKIIQENGEGAKEELKAIIGYISKLKNEVQTNKPLICLQSDGKDVSIWNGFLKKAIENEGGEPRWFESPWLGVECYMYRRVREAFEITKSLSAFDPFREKKNAALLNSIGTIDILSPYIGKLLVSKDCPDCKLEFLKILYVDLWGNRCDLSLSTGKELIFKEDPLETVGQYDKYILVNDSEKIWNVLINAEGKKDCIVDIIMDNAGYELFTDLCLADFLITFSLASKVRLRAKTMPWYVSDTCVPDVHWTLETLSKSENPYTSLLAKRWSQYINSGELILCADEFWTLPYSFHEMQDVDANLYDDLSKAILLIFKGDLNYRKLDGDVNWEPTKPFAEALRGFQPTHLATLRTLKCDTICGLAPGKAEETAAEQADWLISGQYAVIQFS